MAKIDRLCYSFSIVIVDTDTDEKPILDEFRWNLLHKKVQEQRIAKAFSLFRERGIEPIIFKGWAVGAFYPDTQYRPSGDIDLAVASKDYVEAVAFEKTNGVSELAIDLHDRFRNHDTVAWSDLFANSILVDVDGNKVRVLRPEDHLRIVCVHWLNDGGEYKNRLWDIYYMVANRPADFDWDRCLNVVSSTRRRWIVCAIGLTHKYLGLELTGTPIEQEAENLPTWMIQRIEREWRSDVRLRDIATCLREPKILLQQILKRTPPNPIQATIEAGGSLDASFRFHYQIVSMAKRLLPSMRNIWRKVARKY